VKFLVQIGGLTTLPLTNMFLVSNFLTWQFLLGKKWKKIVQNQRKMQTTKHLLKNCDKKIEKNATRNE